MLDDRLDLLIEHLGFPLAPLFELLEADGIRLSPRDYQDVAVVLRSWPEGWGANRLADVLCPLLATSPEMDELIRRRCAGFFTLSEEEVRGAGERRDGDGLSSSEACQRIRQGGQRTNGVAAAEPIEERHASHELRSRIFRYMHIVFITIITLIYFISITFLLMTYYYRIFKVIIVGGVLFLFLTNNILSPGGAWAGWLSVCVHQFRLKLQSHFKKADYQNFPLYSRSGALGAPTPRLRRDTIDAFADALGRFTSGTLTTRLDVPASARATAATASIPDLRFHLRRCDREVLLLEDLTAVPRAWNHIAGELEQGLSQRGITVHRGQFRGGPNLCFRRDGRPLYLEDLDERRDGYLLLLLSDGHGLREHHRLVLQDLARWPYVAWVDLRESCLWDEGVRLPMEAGLPVVPATNAGMVQLVRRFFNEAADPIAAAPPVAPPPSTLPSDPGALALRLEIRLGDALRWAQDCAMLQPLSLGLADGLRREFHPDLPTERLDRLMALPGSQWASGGIRFSPQVHAALRAGFLERDDAGQEAVLDYLLEQIDAAEPPKNSPAHLGWRWTRARVLLDLNPDKAVAELRRLHKIGMADVVSDELGQFGVAGMEEATEDRRLQFRKTPNSPLASARLMAMSGEMSLGVVFYNVMRVMIRSIERIVVTECRFRYNALLFFFSPVNLLLPYLTRCLSMGDSIAADAALLLGTWMRCDVSSDGRYFAAVQNGRVWLYDLLNQSSAPLPRLDEINWIAFSPDGKHLGCCSINGMLSIWSIRDEVVVFARRGVVPHFTAFRWIDGMSIELPSINNAHTLASDKKLRWNLMGDPSRSHRTIKIIINQPNTNYTHFIETLYTKNTIRFALFPILFTPFFRMSSVSCSVTTITFIFPGINIISIRTPSKYIEKILRHPFKRESNRAFVRYDGELVIAYQNRKAKRWEFTPAGIKLPVENEDHADPDRS